MSRAKRMLQHLIPPRGWIVPTSPTLPRALSTIEGRYEMSLGEVVTLYLWTAAFIAIFGFCAGIAWSKYGHGGRQADVAMAAYLAMLILLAVLWVLPRVSARYELRGGVISGLSRGGKVRWREDLATGPRVVVTRDHFNTYMTLHWPDRRRSFVVPDSLAEAIDRAVETGTSVTRAGHAAADLVSSRRS